MKSKYITSLFFILYIAYLQGQQSIVSQTIQIKKLPNELKYQGIPVKAIQYTDSLGKNLVLITETGLFQNKKNKSEMDGMDAELFAYHYTEKENKWVQNWKVLDYIRDCPLDIRADFLSTSLTITDEDKNGIAEVWLVYVITCRGDVSPLTMKIIMYQNSQKYAIRGNSKINMPIDDGTYVIEGGDYKTDPAFKNADESLLKFAKKLWEDSLFEAMN